MDGRSRGETPGTCRFGDQVTGQDAAEVTPGRDQESVPAVERVPASTGMPPELGGPLSRSPFGMGRYNGRSDSSARGRLLENPGSSGRRQNEALLPGRVPGGGLPLFCRVQARMNGQRLVGFPRYPQLRSGQPHFRGERIERRVHGRLVHPVLARPPELRMGHAVRIGLVRFRTPYLWQERAGRTTDLATTGPEGLARGQDRGLHRGRTPLHPAGSRRGPPRGRRPQAAR
jgi:hypothetical protein